MRRSIFTKTIAIIFSFTLIVLAVSNSLNAATTQGTPDLFSSTGTVDISATVGVDIIVFGLQTVSFGTWSIGDGNLANNQDVCIGKSDPFQDYLIQASGDGNSIDPSAFTLTNGVDQINYDVYWNDDAGTGGQAQLSPGSIEFGQQGNWFRFLVNRFRGNQGQACNGAGFLPAVPNANLEIRISDAELSAATGGFYGGVLTLLVMPQ